MLSGSGHAPIPWPRQVTSSSGAGSAAAHSTILQSNRLLKLDNCRDAPRHIHDANYGIGRRIQATVE
eukprot:3299466-Pleurochrysis_carterae.AAC.1